MDELVRIRPTDAEAVFGWLHRTIHAAERHFGILCPTAMIVTIAEQHLTVDQDLTPEFCMIREAARQRDALSRIASRIAHDDDLYTALMEPIEQSDVSGMAVVDTALLILMGTHFGKSADAFWRVLETWHVAQLGRSPVLNKRAFLAVVA
ncbi:MAG: hypothetical protein AAGL89_15430 [Pseudomonadota bacterium]